MACPRTHYFCSFTFLGLGKPSWKWHFFFSLLLLCLLSLYLFRSHSWLWATLAKNLFDFRCPLTDPLASVVVYNRPLFISSRHYSIASAFIIRAWGCPQLIRSFLLPHRSILSIPCLFLSLSPLYRLRPFNDVLCPLSQRFTRTNIYDITICSLSLTFHLHPHLQHSSTLRPVFLILLNNGSIHPQLTLNCAERLAPPYEESYSEGISLVHRNPGSPKPSNSIRFRQPISRMSRYQR